jgi:hypothetical protein
MSQPIRWSLNALPFLVALVLLVAVPKIEAWMFPVISSFTITSIDREGDMLVIKGYMRKNRECKFVGVSAVGEGDKSSVDIPLVFRDYPHDNTGTRPTGTQAWGPWSMTIPKLPRIHSIDIEATHACHPMWTTSTHMAKIPVLEASK